MGDPTRERVLRYYSDLDVDEWRRLAKDPYHRLEYDTTMHFLKKYLPEKGLILDAGGGPGRYTIGLAKLGYDITLLDLTPKLLDIAREQIKKAKVQQKVKQIVQGSIEDLSIFKDESFDAVICLGGPLCHILDKTQGNKAIDELTRVTKKGSPIFTSFIGRLSILTVGLTLPTEMEVDDLYLDVYKTGDYDGNYGFTDCHFYLPEEAVNQLEGKGLRILEVAGLEGFASSHWRETNRVFRKYPKAWKNWWKIHLETCVNPTSVGMSEHFLIVSRKEI